MCKFAQLLTICEGKSVYIQTHNFPDPDAIASAFGLQSLFKNFGIQSILCYDGKIDKLSATKMLDAFNIEMHSYASIKNELHDDDYIVYVDSQKHSGNVTDFIGDEIACIDHHPTFVDIQYLYKDVRLVGSCATLIADYYHALDIQPSMEVATALMYGMKMDTLQFTRGVTEDDIKMYAYLFPFHDEQVLGDLERNNLEAQDLKAYGAVIENIEIYDRIGISCIPFACPDALIAVLSDFILALEEVEFAVIFSYRDNGVKFSVRSEDPELHAGKVIHIMLRDVGDGGGHQEMAGGFIPFTPTLTKSRLTKDYLVNMCLSTILTNTKGKVATV